MLDPMMMTQSALTRSCWYRSRGGGDRKSTRLNSSHGYISYAVFCLKKKKVVVADSVAALQPKAGLQGGIGDSLPLFKPRLRSMALRKLAGGIHPSRKPVVLITQLLV